MFKSFFYKPPNIKSAQPSPFCEETTILFLSQKGIDTEVFDVMMFSGMQKEMGRSQDYAWKDYLIKKQGAIADTAGASKVAFY